MLIVFKQIYLTHRWTLTGTTTPSKSEPGSNGNERVYHTTQIFRTGALLSEPV